MLFSAVVLGLPPAESLAFQGRGQGPKAEKAKKAEKKRDDKRDDRQDAVAVDRDRYVRVIREYERGGSLPLGLAKRDSLPPGLRRQLRERGTLPPGLQKRLVVVPGPLGARLPAVPPYYQRYFAGDDLIVVDTRTNRIAAIVRDVWR